ncbi:MAG: TetR/AcrR family transcriptional regulator [Lachnospiraceae bacterium]|nr:TetR/AcrR family transcriptional regulator [Lachnospiraceae bacterium]
MYRKMDEAAMVQLLETGIEEFSNAGLDRANINTIAKKAGMSVGVIYKYYQDKDAFFLACVRYSLQTLDEVLSSAIDKQQSLRENLTRVVRALLQHAKEHRNINVMYNEITSGSCRKYAAQLAEEIEARTALLYQELFENAISEGHVEGDIDPRLLAFFLDNLLMMLQFSCSCDYYRARMNIFCGEDVSTDDEAIVYGMTEFILRGVGGKHGV